ncbi:MAG: NAD(P)-binding protein [Pseudomonadota bacterium]
MNTLDVDLRRLQWRIVIPLGIFASALLGFELGVSTTERGDIENSGLLVKAYYSLSLFVVGGVDLGTPVGGSALARSLLWFAYFAAPAFTASTVMSALLMALAPRSWSVRRLRNHIVIVGDNPLTISYLRALRISNKTKVVVVSSNPDSLQADHYREAFGAIVVAGDIAQPHCFKHLRIEYAARVFLFEESSLACYETAAALLSMQPDMGDRIVIHCSRLRFMRSMENTKVAEHCFTFNAFHLAAKGLVRNRMLQHFKETKSKDVVVIAGFGRFGQSVLEELKATATSELDTVVVIDVDADRRILVAEEQDKLLGSYRREILQGDVSHPDVWRKAADATNLEGDNTLFVLGTGREEENLRTALWLRRKYPQATIIARNNNRSRFASELGDEHDIINISILELVESNIPASWLRGG